MITQTLLISANVLELLLLQSDSVRIAKNRVLVRVFLSDRPQETLCSAARYQASWFTLTEEFSFDVKPPDSGEENTDTKCGQDHTYVERRQRKHCVHVFFPTVHGFYVQIEISSLCSNIQTIKCHARATTSLILVRFELNRNASVTEHPFLWQLSRKDQYILSFPSKGVERLFYTPRERRTSRR